jgi:hypothetical protein
MSTCDDITRSLVEGEALTDALRDHARTCPACNALVRVRPTPVRRGEEAIPPALVAALEADGGAVSPYSAWSVALAPASLATVLVAVALFRVPRRDLARQLGVAFGTATLAQVGLLAAGVAFVVHRGARGLGPTTAQRSAYAAVALPLFALVIAATTRAVPGSVVPEGDNIFHAFAHCAAFGSGIAIVALAALLAAARRSAPVAPALAGAVAGVASGFIGALVLHLACPVATIAHGVLAHGAPAVVGGALGALLGRRVLSP